MKYLMLIVAPFLLIACAEDKTRPVSDAQIAAGPEGMKLEWTCQPEGTRQGKQVYVASLFSRWNIDGSAREYFFQVIDTKVSITKRGMDGGSWGFSFRSPVTSKFFDGQQELVPIGSALEYQTGATKTNPIAVYDPTLKQVYLDLGMSKDGQAMVIQCANQK